MFSKVTKANEEFRIFSDQIEKRQKTKSISLWIDKSGKIENLPTAFAVHVSMQSHFSAYVSYRISENPSSATQNFLRNTSSRGAGNKNLSFRFQQRWQTLSQKSAAESSNQMTTDIYTRLTSDIRNKLHKRLFRSDNMCSTFWSSM